MKKIYENNINKSVEIIKISSKETTETKSMRLKWIFHKIFSTKFKQVEANTKSTKQNMVKITDSEDYIMKKEKLNQTSIKNNS